MKNERQKDRGTEKIIFRVSGEWDRDKVGGGGRGREGGRRQQ